MNSLKEWLNWIDLETSAFLQGATSFASIIVALLFLRFWRKTKDRLFLYFSCSFLIFAVSRAWLAFSGDGEPRTYIYFFRFAAFMMIIWGIIDKNRKN